MIDPTIGMFSYEYFLPPYAHLVLPLARSSPAIGALLGVVASFIIYRNIQLLLGRYSYMLPPLLFPTQFRLLRP